MLYNLNFLPDLPTLNNHIYSMSLLKKMFNKKNIPVLNGYNNNYNNTINIENIIGFANLHTINENIIQFDVKFINNNIPLENVELTTNIICNNKNKIINDGKLLYLFFTSEVYDFKRK